MGARFLDTYLARWLSPDTIVSSPTNPQSLNRYSYVRNNALKYVDPTGHKEEGECGFYGEACKEEAGSSLITPDNLWPAGYYGMTFEQLPLQARQAIAQAGLSPEQWNSRNPGVGSFTGATQGVVNQPPVFDANGNAFPPQTPNGDLPGQWVNRSGRWFYEGEDGNIYRPDRGYTNKFGNEGEQPHWHVTDHNTGDDDTIPPGQGPGGYKWGRRGQRSTPGRWDPERRGYYTALAVTLVVAIAQPLMQVIRETACTNVGQIMLLQGGGRSGLLHPEFR